MSNTDAANIIALVRLVLGFTCRIGRQGINTPGLVDGAGFTVIPVRRFQEIAADRFGASEAQAQLAAIAWVKAGRPERPELV